MKEILNKQNKNLNKINFINNMTIKNIKDDKEEIKVDLFSCSLCNLILSFYINNVSNKLN